MQSQDTLYALAGDTGGKALLDYNDLTKGIVQAQQNITSYYILGYYTSNTAQDGKFRRIKISLNRDLSASLDYRQGYYAGKLFSKFKVAGSDSHSAGSVGCVTTLLEGPIKDERELIDAIRSRRCRAGRGLLKSALAPFEPTQSAS